MSIAVAVVVLLPAELDAEVRRLSQAMTGAGRPRLDDAHLPHITLAQLAIDEDETETLRERVRALAATTPALALALAASDRRRPALALEPSRPLRSLQRAVVDAVAPLARRPVTVAAFDPAPGETARAIDAVYVERHLEAARGDRSRHHVSLGAGDGARLAGRRPFLASAIALCRLGLGATCRPPLAAYSLAGRRTASC